MRLWFLKRRPAKPAFEPSVTDNRPLGGLVLILPEPPSANRWWRMFRSRMVVSTEARRYKEMVDRLLKARRLRPIAKPGGVIVGLDWFRGRKAGDLDKRLGVLLDAMQGTAYENDGQIVELHARRFDDPGNGRVVVIVSPANP